MYVRRLTEVILKNLNESEKIILLFGARQVGKTTLLKEVVAGYLGKSLWMNGDLQNTKEVLSRHNIRAIKDLLDDNKLLIIDEAQNIPNIGLTLKIIFDELPDIRVVATGSSSLELANTTMEALTGRTRTFHLFPMSLLELRRDQSVFEIKDHLESHLVYGMYPEVLTLTGGESKRTHLRELVSSYLYKDILQLSNIRHSDKIHKLLQLLAFQIGNLVSVNELSKTLQLNHETINNYIDLLEKGFIIQRLSGLSNNPRNEISKMDKFYFTDIGIRNAVIENFAEVPLRNDLGALWENFIVLERLKFLNYNNIHSKNYFWRRYSGAEIDWVEQRDGRYYAFEIKWGNRKTNVPKSWVLNYPDATFTLVTKSNFTDAVI